MNSRVIFYGLVLAAWANLACAQTTDASAPAPSLYCTAKIPALCPVADKPGLPRVLLIGDSISIGYTLRVRQLLADVANVHRIPRNGGTTEIGLENLEQWLEGGKWDVIHVNFGIHDARLMPMGIPTTDINTYSNNIRTILERLKATGARVIWATSTPIPPDVVPPDHRWADITVYNKVANQIAQQEGVSIDDLYSVVKPQEAELQRPQNVHFNGNGWDVLARAVANSISHQLHSK